VLKSLSYASLDRSFVMSRSSERGGVVGQERRRRGVLRSVARALFFRAVLTRRSSDRRRGTIHQSDSIWLEGQPAVKAAAATGRGKPLGASTPRTDSA
jgi:hypothetical protein